jgi:peptide/nickel transport system ATP-binding protein
MQAVEVSIEAPVLKVNNLKKNYYRPGSRKRQVIRAVKGVDFSVNVGTITGLIGTSGCGKTTILKMIFGIERPSDGEVWLGDGCLTSTTTKKRRSLLKRMGLVFQDPFNSLCPRYSVRQILIEPLLIHGIIKKGQEGEARVKEMLQRLELNPLKYIDRYPHQLSGGERQRIALGRAMMLEPVFLALDEPTSMVDATTKKGIIDLIKKLTRDTGAGVLLVTHDLAMAAHICDYVMVMKDGVIVERGQCAEVIQSPREEYTRKLLLAATDLEKYWESI